ncbi:MAG: fibronectin type III domain-containing protein, partial [Thermoplasmata archaeon]
MQNGEVHLFYNSIDSTLVHSFIGMPPLAPQSVSASPGNKRITLSWQKPQSKNIVKYEIYRGLSPSSMQYLANVSGSTFSFVDVNVTNGVNYYYYIKACNQFGCSPNSQVVNATPSQELGSPPKAPTYLSSPPIAKQGVYLEWGMSPDAIGMDIVYNIYRGDSPNSLTYIGKTTSLNYNDTTTKGNRYYYYQVKAANEFGESPGTEIIQAWSVPPIWVLKLSVSPDKFYVDSETKDEIYDIRVAVQGWQESGYEKVVNATVSIFTVWQPEVFGVTGKDGSYTFKNFKVVGKYIGRNIIIRASIHDSYTQAQYKIEKTPDSIILVKRIFALRFFFITLAIGAIAIPTTYVKLRNSRSKRIRELEIKIDKLNDEEKNAKTYMDVEKFVTVEDKDGKDSHVEPKKVLDKWKEKMEYMRFHRGVISKEFIDKAELSNHAYGYAIKGEAKEEKLIEKKFELRAAPHMGLNLFFSV